MRRAKEIGGSVRCASLNHLSSSFLFEPSAMVSAIALSKRSLSAGVGLADGAGDARAMDRGSRGTSAMSLHSPCLAVQEIREGERVGDDVIETAVD